MDARNSAGVSARIAVVGLVTAALLGGCDGGEGSSASSSSSSSSSAGVSGSATSSSVPSSTSSTSSSSSATAYVPVKPQFPAEAKKHTDAGAVAFVKYYWAAMNFAWTKPDADILLGLGKSSCRSCSNLEDTARLLLRDGQRMDQPPIEVMSAYHVYTAKSQTQVITKVKRTTASTVDATGKVLKTNSPSDALRAFRLEWSGSWKVVEIGEG